MTNDNGYFESSEAITLIHQAELVIDENSGRIEFPIQDLVIALQAVNADAKACEIDPQRPDCVAGQADPQSSLCMTIERVIVEQNLGTIWSP